MTSANTRFLGTTIRQDVVAGFTLSETSYSPGQVLRSHSHERASFCLVLHGGFTETYRERIRICYPPTLIFRPPAEVHLNQFESIGGRCFNIEVGPHWLEHADEYARMPEVSDDFDRGLLPSLALRLYREFRMIDEVAPLVIEGLALEMLGEVSRATNRSRDSAIPGWLIRARDFLHENFANPCTLSLVAETVRVHPVHLARVFRQHYHSSVGEYIRKLRVEFACRRLVESSASLCQISLESGFAHQSHFSTTFKRLTRITPAAYRATFRCANET